MYLLGAIKISLKAAVKISLSLFVLPLAVVCIVCVICLFVGFLSLFRCVFYVFCLFFLFACKPVPMAKSCMRKFAEIVFSSMSAVPIRIRKNSNGLYNREMKST